jgi:hypothetical protein
MIAKLDAFINKLNTFKSGKELQQDNFLRDDLEVRAY